MPRTKSKSNNYWTPETESAIIQYNSITDPILADKLYMEKLHSPLSKMVECIFNTFKFTHFDDSNINVQQDALSYAVQLLNKFDPAKGAGKSFGYFSIIIKNYLILRSNKSYKANNRQVEIVDSIDLSEDEEKSSEVILSTVDRIHKEVDPEELLSQVRAWWIENASSIFAPKLLQVALALFNFDSDLYSKNTDWKCHRDLKEKHLHHNRVRIIEDIRKQMPHLRSDYIGSYLSQIKEIMLPYNEVLKRNYVLNGIATCKLTPKMKHQFSKRYWRVKQKTISIDTNGVKTEHKYLVPINTNEKRKMDSGARIEIRSRYNYDPSCLADLANEFGRTPAEILNVVNMNKKTYTKNCPMCGSPMIYEKKSDYNRSIKKDTKCRTCSNKKAAKHIDRIGSHNPNAKLSDEQIKEILAKRGTMTNKELAKQYNVQPNTIYRVCRREMKNNVATIENPPVECFVRRSQISNDLLNMRNDLLSK
jgi:hypothetical protein